MRQGWTSPREQATRTLLNRDGFKTLTPESLAMVLQLALADVSEATAKEILTVLSQAVDQTPTLRKGALEKYHKVDRLVRMRDAIVEEYGIEVVGQDQVWVSLKGKSRIEIIRAMNEAFMEIYGEELIDHEGLKVWAFDKNFRGDTHSDQVIGVHLSVPDSASLSSSQQEARGWNDVNLSDLAVAWAAHSLATGSSPKGSFVRCRDGGLRASGAGFYSSLWTTEPDSYTFASSRLPPRN